MVKVNYLRVTDFEQDAANKNSELQEMTTEVARKGV